ncbi:DUF4180 domain-containing protein [Streptomyces sp. NBRC 109706]|uniref:DUF4180 domain-containing protein n=1 Tax=Streptomyces sp. NBRC 109706 TaxID=1550035 RepID=UPI0007861407|nr:DUF4180 domain-containing protein [Streptomyces sp. NBRC 109706]
MTDASSADESPFRLETIGGVPVAVCPAEGPAIAAEADVMDIVGNATYQGARWAVIPAERFADAFFQLRTRLAGDIVQKFVNYRLGLAIIGDISHHTAASSSLRDFVHECDTGHQTWFLPDLPTFHQRLKTTRAG